MSRFSMYLSDESHDGEVSSEVSPLTFIVEITNTATLVYGLPVQRAGGWVQIYEPNKVNASQPWHLSTLDPDSCIIKQRLDEIEERTSHPVVVIDPGESTTQQLHSGLL